MPHPQQTLDFDLTLPSQKPLVIKMRGSVSQKGTPSSHIQLLRKSSTAKPNVEVANRIKQMLQGIMKYRTSMEAPGCCLGLCSSGRGMIYSSGPIPGCVGVFLWSALRPLRSYSPHAGCSGAADGSCDLKV